MPNKTKPQPQPEYGTIKPDGVMRLEVARADTGKCQMTMNILIKEGNPNIRLLISPCKDEGGDLSTIDVIGKVDVLEAIIRTCKEAIARAAGAPVDDEDI